MKRLIRLPALTIVLLSITASAADPVLTEWTVPWEQSRPRDPYVDSANTVWFAASGGDGGSAAWRATALYLGFDVSFTRRGVPDDP